MPESRPESFDDEIRLLAEVTGPSDFVIVDEPAVAFASRRLVPPNAGGHLDGPDPLALAGRRRCDRRGDERTTCARCSCSATGSAACSRSRSGWTSEYVAIKINERRNGKDRAVYLRQDADLDGARVAAGASPGPSQRCDLRRSDAAARARC